MDIRKKTLLVLGIAFIAIFCVIAGVSMFLYNDQLGRLEHQQVSKDMTEVIGAISNEQDDLSNTLHDWSYWDETYQFALDHNQDYITQNLDEMTITGIRVTLLIVTDTQGHIIYGKVVDPVTGHESPLPENFSQLLPRDHPFLTHTSLPGTNTGILLLPSGPVMIASSPVLNNTREGPSHGVLVMGRALDKREFDRISRATGNPTSAHWNGDTSAGNLQQSLLEQMKPDSAAVTIPHSDGTISGYEVISDVNGQKILIETDQPRDLYQNGLDIIKTYLVLFVLILLVTLVIVLLVVDQIVLKRLNRLKDRVVKIGQGHHDDMKPELTGDDEITLLEQAILTANTALKNSEQELRKFSTSLATTNQKLNILSRLTRKDLNNQIFVLNSYLELAKHQLTGPGSIDKTFEGMVVAIRETQKIIEYTQDYQDMGAKPPIWQNVKTTSLLGLSHISIGNIQHSLETGDLEIFADPLLEKVCQRLFENSFIHGEHVTLIRVWYATTTGGVTIFFEDDGIGIPREKKEKIFLRGDGSRASRGSLIFVREILDITGISIQETGEPGKGVRFEITVPNGAYRMTVVSDQ
ncbi:MAG: CHASE4 domain-containing protein [Methanomicrobiales archaeon]